MKKKTRMKKILEMAESLKDGESTKSKAILVAAVDGVEMTDDDALLASLIHNEAIKRGNKQ